jgi:hypothetical protein
MPFQVDRGVRQAGALAVQGVIAGGSTEGPQGA